MVKPIGSYMTIGIHVGMSCKIIVKGRRHPCCWDTTTTDARAQHPFRTLVQPPPGAPREPVRDSKGGTGVWLREVGRGWWGPVLSTLAQTLSKQNGRDDPEEVGPGLLAPLHHHTKSTTTRYRK